MHRIALSAIVAVTGLALAKSPAPAIAQPPSAESSLITPSPDRNAALLYYRAWFVHQNALEEYRTNDWSDAQNPDPALTAFLEHNQEFIADLVNAASYSNCDWEIEYEDGIGALLPHLGAMRNCARLLNADAYRLANLEEAAGAAERVAALYRMAAHQTNDRILISSLVSAAITSLANSTTETLIASGILTPAARDTILDAMDRFNPDDPFGVKQGIAGERDIFLAWIQKTYTGPGAGWRLVSETLPLLAGPADNDQDPYLDLRMLTGDRLSEEAQKASKAYDDMIAIWDVPDAADRLEGVGLLVESGHYGRLARLLVPAASKANQSDHRIRAELQLTREHLEQAEVKPEPAPSTNPIPSKAAVGR